MGIGIYVMAAVAKLTPEDVIKETLPLLIPLLIALLLITYDPRDHTMLPKLFIWKRLKEREIVRYVYEGL